MHTHTHLTALISLVLFISVHLSLCSAQHSAVGQSIIAPNSIQDIQEYKKDASRLALRYLSQQQNISEIGIKIPEDIKESLYKALWAVYKSDDQHAIRVRQLGIHTQAQPFYIDYLTVVHADDTEWAIPLDKGEPRTSNETINQFIETYNLDINEYDDENKSFIISAYPHINMNGLAKELSQVDGVAGVHTPNLITPNKHNITTKRERNTWVLTYEKEYRNADKTSYKIQWSFSVDEAGNVIFLGELEVKDLVK